MSFLAKSWLRAAALVVSVLALVALLTAGFLFQQSRASIGSAKAWVDATIPLIAESWSPDELRAASSPRLLEQNKDAEKVLIAINDRLGPLKQYKGSQFRGRTFERQGKTRTGFLIFRVEIVCEDGDAKLDVAVTWLEGGWRLTQFFIHELKPRHNNPTP